MVDLVVLANRFEKMANEDIPQRRERLIELGDLLYDKLGHPQTIDAPDMTQNQWYWSMANAVVDGSEKRDHLREPFSKVEKIIEEWLSLALDMRL